MDWATLGLLAIGALGLAFFVYHLIQIASGREKTGDDAERELAAKYWQQYKKPGLIGTILGALLFVLVVTLPFSLVLIARLWN